MRFKEKIIFLATLLGTIVLLIKYVDYINKRDNILLNQKYKISIENTTYITNHYIKDKNYIIFTDEYNREIEIADKYVKIEIIN